MFHSLLGTIVHVCSFLYITCGGGVPVLLHWTDECLSVLVRSFLLSLPISLPSYAVIAYGCASCPKLTCGREGCQTEFCYHCKQIWHPNQTCDMARQQRAQTFRVRTKHTSGLSYGQESGPGINWHFLICLFYTSYLWAQSWEKLHYCVMKYFLGSEIRKYLAILSIL